MFMKLYKVIFFTLFILGFTLIVSQKVEAAILSVTPEIVSAQAGEEFTIEVTLDTESKSTDGADVVLRYDPEKIEALSVIAGVTYPEYPIQKIEEGKISITGLASSTGPFFSGKDLFASVRFKPLFGGEEVVSIDFTQDSTIESNVALHGKGTDILTGVEDSVLYISGQPVSNDPLVDAGTVGRILLVIFYIDVITLVGFVIYRWWSKKIRSGEEAYTPEQVPMDRPPEF